MISEESVSQLRRLAELREARDLAKTAADKAVKEFREAEADVFEAFEDGAASGGMKVDLGEPWGTITFRPRETYYAKVIDVDALQDYYEQRAMVEEMSSIKFTAKRLNEEVRDRIEQGESMPEGLSYYVSRGITMTRQKS